MATATNDNTSGDSVYNAARRQQLYQGQREGYPKDSKVYKQTVALATGDLVLNATTPLIVFPTIPSGVYLVGLAIKSDDMDSGSAAKFDIAAYDSTGASIVTLISQTTIPQTGGSKDMDANVDPTLRDMSGLTLKLKVQTAPAGAVAGNLTVYAIVSYNVLTTF